MPDIDGLIELSPEANPLTPHNLTQTLLSASSTQQSLIRTGTQQLSNWESEPGYYSALQAILLDINNRFDVRYLAVIQLKNGIDKYWRKSAKNALSKDEKTLIKSRCLEYGTNEADHRLALQNAILFSKIVRHEFPDEWPDVLTTVTQALREAASEDAGGVHLPRTLLIVLYIIKELSTARLMRFRTNLFKATPDMFKTLASIYVQKVDSWLGFMKQGGTDEARAINDIELSLLALRALRRLLVAGYEYPARNDEVHEFWNVIRMHFAEILPMVGEHKDKLPAQIRWFLEKHLLQMSKIHLAVIRVHPNSFPQLPEAIGIARAYWGLLEDFGETYGTNTTAVPDNDDMYDDSEPSFMEKLSLKALLLLRSCAKMVYNPMNTFTYPYLQDKEERRAAIDTVRERLLDDELVREMVSTLISRFFTYTARDLWQWNHEPAEWEHSQGGSGDTWEYSVRLCAERLYLDIVTHNKHMFGETLLKRFHEVATPDNKDVLQKDSMYSAVGLAASVIEAKTDFDGFMRTTLVADIQTSDPAFKILRRRIAIMLGEWIVVKDIDRSFVYQIFQHLLNKDDPSNDWVVRMTAGRQIHHVIQTWELQVDKLAPYAADILDRLLGLVSEAELVESKLSLLTAINSTVVRLDTNVVPYADRIVSLLPPLWEQAGTEYVMKQHLFGILSELISAMKVESARFHPHMLPLIAGTVRSDSEERELLLADALELWVSVLRQTTDSAASQHADLIPCLLPILEMHTEMMSIGLELTEQYVLLAPEMFLKEATPFLTAFAEVLSGHVRVKVGEQIACVVEKLLQRAHELGDWPGVQMVTKLLIDTKFLHEIISGLKEAYEAGLTSGPYRIDTPLDQMLETDYVSVLARIVWSSPKGFGEAIAASEGSFDDVFGWLLKEWFTHFQDMGNTERRKLTCIALTKLFEVDGLKERLLGHLQDYIVTWTDVISECMEFENDDPSTEGRDCMVYDNIEKLRYEGMPETPEDERRRKLLFFDPVHRVHIKHFIRDAFRQIVETSGGGDAFQRDWLVNVDKDVVKGFARLHVV